MVARVLLTFIVVLLSTQLSAATLFTADVPVTSQTTSERKQALASAMASVLIKVSGDDAAPISKEGAQAIKNARRYLLQYRYDTASDDLVEQGFPLVLRAKFDEGKVSELLKQSELGLWPDNRPQTLLWVIVDTIDQGRAVLTSEPNPLVAGLLSRADQRGLP